MISKEWKSSNSLRFPFLFQYLTRQMIWYLNGILPSWYLWWWSPYSCHSWSWFTTPQRTAPLPTQQAGHLSISRSSLYTLSCLGNFTCLMVEFKFRRRLGYFMFHTYIPTCLIVMMSWISFWIKPEAVPARVTLGVTSLLTLSTQHANSQKSLPPVSYIKVRQSQIQFLILSNLISSITFQVKFATENLNVLDTFDA